MLHALVMSRKRSHLSHNRHALIFPYDGPLAWIVEVQPQPDLEYCVVAVEAGLSDRLAGALGDPSDLREFTGTAGSYVERVAGASVGAAISTEYFPKPCD